MKLGNDFGKVTKEPTYLKGVTPSCTDLVLTNQKLLSMKSTTF